MKLIKRQLCLLAGIMSLWYFQPACADISGLYQVTSEEAPKAIGPYSQAVRAGQFLFISGQLGIDPATSNFVEGTVAEQTRQVLDNIEAILRKEGLTFENVIKSEVYLQDINDFQVVNRCYAERFVYPIKPARQTMAVGALPRAALVEISCIAYIPESQ